MDPDSPLLLSLRRSRNRLRVLRAAGELGSATVAQLARRAGIPLNAVWPAIFGDDEGYRRDLSLSRLELVRVRLTRLGDVIEITEHGREVLALLEERYRSTGLRPW
jgi:DNA-binding MarR family transcriptional regulator